MRTCVNIGESMRSDVSSSRRRSDGEEILQKVEAEIGDEGVEKDSGLGKFGGEDVIPDALRTKSSSSRDGRREASHFCLLLYVS